MSRSGIAHAIWCGRFSSETNSIAAARMMTPSDEDKSAPAITEGSSGRPGESANSSSSGASSASIAAPRAIVFAYHDVGVRCLQVLLENGLDVPLVVTHRDDPAEQRWF